MQDHIRNSEKNNDLEKTMLRAKISGKYLISISLVSREKPDDIEHHLFTQDFKYADFFATLYEIEKLVKKLYDKRKKI